MHAPSEFLPEIILVSLHLANTKLGRSGICTDDIQTKISDNLDGRHACSGSVRGPRYRVGNVVPRSCSGGLGVSSGYDYAGRGPERLGRDRSDMGMTTVLRDRWGWAS